ncbi:MAG: family transporter solute-binding subunit [Clostridia bacterium]|jgi:TRAP transporter TAXI family solute receptor|nr:family transporter solute-binding subunit [Clostridia bacterium]
MKKTLYMLLVLILASSVLTACGGNQTSKVNKVSEGSTVSEENKTVEKPKFLTIGTAGTGGAYYPIGITMAQIVTEKLGIDTTAQVTGGATENNSLIEAGTVEMGITQASLAYAAINGKAPYDSKLASVQGIMTGLSKGTFHVVTLKSTGIKAIEDLKGKTVVLGPAGGAAITMANEVFGEYGFTKDDIKPSYVSYSDGMSALTDGTVDAVVVQSAAPASAIQELAATRAKDMLILSVKDEIVQKMVEKYPYYKDLTIPADVYKTESDIRTIYVPNMVVCSSKLSDELVYDITKAFFENLDKIKGSNAAAKDLTLEGAAEGCPIDIHPGALKYYKEVGAIK